uniref:Uncharacterized protein n=1 Tax=Rhizophora mucronata TaxID=61149 RepID=A0A2P2II84_RHIMU
MVQIMSFDTMKILENCKRDYCIPH